jgi:hypothetical protein
MAADIEGDQKLEDECISWIGRGEKAEKTSGGTPIQSVSIADE